MFPRKADFLLPRIDWLSALLIVFVTVVPQLKGQAANSPSMPVQPGQSKMTVLDGRSQTSLSSAYENACANGGMIVVTPDYKSSEAMPSTCKNYTAVLDLRRPDSLTGRLNVRNEGAVGDGQKDDTDALKKTIAFAIEHPFGPGPKASPVIYLPAGTYKISSTLRIPAEVHLIGDGPDTTSLALANPTSNLITIYRGNCPDWGCNGSIEGVGFTGGGHATTGTLLEVLTAGFHIRDVKMYNHGGRGLQLNLNAERFSSENLYIYAVRWPIILAGDINESYFWNTQIINPGATNEAVPGEMAGDKYCYNVNCVNGVFPHPNAGPGGTPTPVSPDGHAAIYVDKAVNFSFYGGSIKPLKYLSGFQLFNQSVSAIRNFYFEGFPWDKAGRLNAAIIAGGQVPQTSFKSALSVGGNTVQVASTDWMPQFFGDSADINPKSGNSYPYVILPQDYLSGSNEPSKYVPGVKRGQYELVNVAGFGSDGKVYFAIRNSKGGTSPANASWPSGSILEEFPIGTYGAPDIENSHINAIIGPEQGYKDNCDQSSVRTCAEIIVGYPPDGLFIDPVGGPNSRGLGASVHLRSVEMFQSAYPHSGEIATHRYASIILEGSAHIPNRFELSSVVDPHDLRMQIWEQTGGSYLTAPTYANGHTAQPVVTFPGTGGVFSPANGLFARYSSINGQGGYGPGGWMNGIQYANQYCWFDTPAAGQKQATNRICMNGGPSNTAHPGYEYDIWTGAKWVNAFQVQGKPDGTADLLVSGSVIAAKGVGSRSGGVVGVSNSVPVAGGPSMGGATGAIGGSMLAPGQCAKGLAQVRGAAINMVASASPVSDPGDGFIWQAYVSGLDTVTVKVCSLARGVPKAVAYNVHVQ